jgi:hypothetical protein
MARIHFISGEKGGVGKSFTARILAQYFIDLGVPFIGFDSDQSHSTFSRFYSEFNSPVDVDDYESLDKILEFAEQKPRAEIVVDLAAQTSRKLDAWMEESELFEILKTINSTAYIWHIMDDGADSARLLEAVVDKFSGSPAQLVVVKNMGRGNNFELFDKSSIFEKAQKNKAIFLTLPKLQSALAQKIDFYNFSFWAASNNAKAMTTAERQRVKVWRVNCYEKFNRFLKND